MSGFNSSDDQLDNNTVPVGPFTCMYWCDMDVRYGLYIFKMLTLIAQPILSLVGVFGNIATMIVLKRQGLKRSTNILLFSLALSDFLYLVGLNDARTFYDLYPNHGVTYSQAKVLFAGAIIQGAIMEIGNTCTVWIAAFITLERIVAVYLPLKFNSIVLPKRVMVALAILYIYAIINSTIVPMEISFKYNPVTGVMDTTESILKLKYGHIFHIRFQIHNYVVGVIPICIVTLGCFLIGNKVRQARIARLKMLKLDTTEKKPGTVSAPRASRTTITLLIVCIVFVLTIGPAFGIATFYKFNWTVLQIIFNRRVNYLLYCINSSANFFIYTISNDKFRETFMEIFPCLPNILGITIKDKKASFHKTASMG